jgi:sterol desaturase/sphingolipid hydroxylase (fatty acid hydroxylase superfamily)
MKHWLETHADYFTFPTLLCLILFTDRFTMRAFPIQWVAALAFGFVLWTFTEYWVHRSLLHRFFWHGTHEHHHLNPLEDVAFPLWYVPAGFIGIWIPFWASEHFGNRFALAMYGGVVAGYMWFMFMHWILHHNPRATEGTERFAIWHNRHHRLNDCNYGITTRLWDVVFGTSR